ncbi:urate hydroxylase PuuD [Cohaesibacter celericrescens]|uniref:Cysteine desulfurase n=1 Tax=Cohaesibacter celericrescens TaxID=2067669 RepID=A0A2N5XWB1_9HYPH|nr:urate hydroxylase PuuD [Cohaesibacter celericrescens]PLW78806.1 cysteine desulfurase [Cohaesibacter celericrescens]
MLDFDLLQPLVWSWMEFAIRWLHLITAMAWIGSSFYFIALDLGLRKAPDLPVGAHGEEWQVHGGGFYHIRKFLVAPEAMPEHLIWFKWESYTTWLSGAALLMVTYWAGAELFLIDSAKMELEVWQAILVSAGSLTIGWIVYDFLCKSKLDEKPTFLMVLLFILLVVMGWGYNEVFTGRAVLLHLGAFTATIMTANVFFIIMPNQRIVVADLKAGRVPDAKYGKIAKLRSTHNNYLTLPVIFLMLSNHYPLAFASPYNWVIAALVFLMGVTIRHYFNSKHAGKGHPIWTIPATIVLFIAVIWISLLPAEHLGEEMEESSRPLSPSEQKFASADGFEEVSDIIMSRCSMCHARETAWDGIGVAPRGLYLEHEGEIARAAQLIFLNAGVTNAMPPANVTYMEPEERRAIVKWFTAASKG